MDKGHFTYERNLGADGAPVITWASVNEDPALESTEARSIGYVFGKGYHHAVTAYEGILNTPLKYNSSTGYYTYDSAENAVDFDVENDWLYVRGYKEQGWASALATGFDRGDGVADFFPFNSRIQKDADGNITFVQDSESYKTADGTYYHYDNNKKTGLVNPDYWFGASMNASFYYPKNGAWKGEPMKYEFSGDDDVMVYIDNIYVMDLGGAHSRASGEIDFATGLVETWLDAANQPTLYPSYSSYDHKEWAADAASANALKYEDGFYYDTREPDVDEKGNAENNLIRYYPTTIYECYKAAYEEQRLDPDAVAAKLAEVFVKIEGETVEDAYGNEHDVYRFRDYSVHDFKWFYLERHSFEANFYTKFNLPAIPQNSLTIEKVVDDRYNRVADDALYAFEVWATDKNGEESEKIDTVKLKAGESAVINNIIAKTKADEADDHFGFVVKELGQVFNVDGVETYSLDGYTTTWVGGGNANPENGYITAELSAETSQIVLFTNSVIYNPPAQTSVSVEKVWNDNDNEAGLRPDSITVVLLENGEEYGTVELSVDNNWKHTWHNLSEESSWSVEEVEVDGYIASVSVSGNSYTITNTLAPDDIPEEDPPLAPNPDEAPQTGDNANLMVMIICAVVSAAMVVLVLTKKSYFMTK